MKMALARGPGCYGGIFRRFRELAAFGVAAGHEVFGIVPLADSDEPLRTPVRSYAYAKTRLRPSILMANTVEAALAACEPLIEAVAADLRREQPDVVLAVDTDLKGLVVIEACHRAGLPVTTIVAGLATREAEFESRRAPGFVAPVEQFCLERSDLLMFPAKTPALLCQRLWAGMAPYQVFYNGIADEFLDAPAPGPDPRRVGAVMRLSGVKNPEMLGRVATALRERGVRMEAMTGRPSRGLTELLASVTLVPQTNDDAAMAAFYGSCRAVLSPSRFEVSGNVPMEALATGTPAVVTDRMGISEVFGGLGLQHLVVAVDDVEGAVERLLSAEPVADAVREHLREEWRWPAVCERILAAAAVSAGAAA